MKKTFFFIICWSVQKNSDLLSNTQASLKNLLGSPVGLEHLEEYLCENLQKSVDGTVGLQVENCLLNCIVYTDLS